MTLVSWHGDEIYAAIHAAAGEGVRETLDASVIEAKTNHPSWKRGESARHAEDSIRAEKPTEQVDGWLGRFGSDLHRFVFLEVGFRGFAGDHTLRRAADLHFPDLAPRIGRIMRSAMSSLAAKIAAGGNLTKLPERARIDAADAAAGRASTGGDVSTR